MFWKCRKQLTALLTAACAVAFALSQPLTAYALTPLNSENFDSQKYASKNPDVLEAIGLDHDMLWNHYAQYGVLEGRIAFATSGDEGFLLTKESFDYIRYADMNPDLKALYGYDKEALWQHFETSGQYEGRRAFATGDAIGIDVSSYQGDINWGAVKASGIDYAVIRLGYRGSVNPRIVEDHKFQQNIRNATAAGVRVGIYFVTQAVNEDEAREEANYCLNAVSGWNLAMPVFVDVEGSGGRGDTIDRGMRTNVLKTFCQTITNGGRLAGVYASKKWMTENIDMSQLTQYAIWVAQYHHETTWTQTRIDSWQFTSSGSVPGIAGRVDMNRIYVRW